jgi:cellulose synthase/poly-beta-1,6-N-acetylglucosamine synthase-like glycosyltransferase
VSKYDVFRNLFFWFLGLAAFWSVPVCQGLSRSRDNAQRMDKNDSDIHRQRISIIIPARNEEHNLPNLLHSLRCQTTAVDEVIVVDDQSTDHTAAVAQGAGARVVDAGELPAGWMEIGRASCRERVYRHV